MNKIYITLIVFGLCMLFCSCSNLENKAFGAAGGVDAIKIETSGGSTTGTLLPNLTAGGAVSAIATSPSCETGKTGSPVFSMSKRNSLFGELFGINCSTTAVVYIGTPGESSKDTENRLKVINELIKK